MPAATALLVPPARQRASEAVLDPVLCWRMVRSRDPRFDGLFFFGVKTTGIYCRPVCPARTPLAAHCVFFEHAVQAEHHGFRPCLRCRPELAPGRWLTAPPVSEEERRIRSAITGLDQALLGEEDRHASPIHAVAQRLGVSDRHLRRIFVRGMGVSPQAYLQTRRLLMAKRLLTDTRLPVIEVAAIAGFSSLRRFNASWRQQYGFTPTQLRRHRPALPGLAADSGKTITDLTFSLPTRPPFDLGALLAFFQRRQVEGLEWVSTQRMRRALVILNAEGVAHAGWIEIRAIAEARGSGITVRMSPSLAPVIASVLDRVRRAFDLSCRPEAIALALGPLVTGHEGLRIPGALDGFETAVRAIVGQQITVAQATRRVSDLVSAFGTPVHTPWPEVTRAFPSAACLAGLPLDQLSQVLQHRARARAIHSLAHEVAAGRLALEPTTEIDAPMAALKAIPGVGEWTAQYVALRALGWPDAFPESDAGLLKALGTRSPRQAGQRAQIWRPYRGYAAIHLWSHGMPPGDHEINPLSSRDSVIPTLPDPDPHDPDPAC